MTMVIGRGVKHQQGVTHSGYIFIKWNLMREDYIGWAFILFMIRYHAASKINYAFTLQSATGPNKSYSSIVYPGLSMPIPRNHKYILEAYPALLWLPAD
ncbi:hypothetical protein EEL51_12125 [Muribaculaceae bacterium Isolate-110 (HZI)]|nr:hypothetical protein EEL51_12125 [Muribaculaceae bacterium Isolate-110 (HZI)]